VLALPSILIEAILPAPDTFAKATAFAVAALDTSPLTFAPATLFAVAANATSPVTFAPVIADKPEALPLNIPVPPAISMLPALVVIFALEFKLPYKINDVKAPTLVIFGCAAVVNVPANLEAVNVPVVLLNVKLALPAYVVPPSLKITCEFDPAAGETVVVVQTRLPDQSVIKY